MRYAKRIAKSPAGGLRRVRAADVSAHADFEHHTLLRHVLRPMIGLPRDR